LRFLIDECLHPSLAEVAHGAGYEAHHINFLGLASTKDHDLMPRIVEGDFVFVTHNAVDFRRLYRGQPLHAGLIILVPQSPPARQRALFAAAIEEVGGEPGLINEALEVLVEGDEVVFQRYAWPDPGLLEVTPHQG
jgi:predicted nuclease of predicted toxin-antitoxin system